MASLAISTGQCLHCAELLFDDLETRLILKFFCPQATAKIEQMTVTDEIREAAQVAIIRAIDDSADPGVSPQQQHTKIDPRLKGICAKLLNNYMKRWWKYTSREDLKDVRISRTAFAAASKAISDKLASTNVTSTPNFESDVRLIVATFDATVAKMIASGKRLPGSGTITGVLNNAKRHYLSEGMYDCADQAIEVLNEVRKTGVWTRWELNLIGSPPHYKAQAVPFNSAAPLITMDPWVNRYEVKYPPYQVSTEKNVWNPN